jgi:hypothetical protein
MTNNSDLELGDVKLKKKYEISHPESDDDQFENIGITDERQKCKIRALLFGGEKCIASFPEGGRIFPCQIVSIVEHKLFSKKWKLQYNLYDHEGKLISSDISECPYDKKLYKEIKDKDNKMWVPWEIIVSKMYDKSDSGIV